MSGLFGAAPPGSARWLLGHELRQAWYGAAFSKGGRRRPGAMSIVAWSAGFAALHVFAWALLSRVDGGGLPATLLAPVATLVLAVCATFMLSTALKACVLALFERGDLDLLLSSPLPSRSVFAVRLLGVAASTGALFLYLFAPFAHVGLVRGHPGWLGIYGAVGGIAMVAACAAMLLTLALVRVLGARRTRVLAQVLAALAGAALFLLTQLGNLLGYGDTGIGRVLAAFAHHPLLAAASPLWLPGRAALGAPLPLLGLVVLAGAAFFLTVGRTHRFFVHGLQQAAGGARAAVRPAGALRLRFRASLFDAIVVKEWRLIARDPHLISQVLLQTLYLLPLLFVMLRDGGTLGIAFTPAMGAGLTLLCSSITGGLAWIVISAEDAPDLLLSAPAAQRTIRLAKLAAAGMPALLLVALPLLWLVVHAPLAGLLVAFTTVAAVVSAVLIVEWVGRPALRSDFRMRGKENFLCTMFELLSTIAWGGLAWMLVALAGGAAGLPLVGAPVALATACIVLLLAWLLRRRQDAR